LQFWTTLPGILTGIAAVLTAVVAVFGVLSSGGGKSGGGNGDGGTTTIENRASSASATTTRVANEVNQPEGVLARGHLALMELESADLEQGRIEMSTTTDVILGTADLLFQNNAFLAPTDGPLDKPSCVSALTLRHKPLIDLSQIDVGSLICVNTTEGHVAGLTITSVPGVGTSELAFDYTVWK
jgi:hypothetical protein